MSNYAKRRYKDDEPGLFGGNYYLIPIMLVLVIVPLIMRAYIYDPELAGFPWFSDSTSEIDIFLV